MILKAGLTGGIASGKSTVAGFLRDLGAFVVDADRTVAELYEPGQPGHSALVDAFGSSILQDDGRIDRVALSNLAFRDAQSSARLNALIHPLVMAATDAQIADEAQRRGSDFVAVVEATLLLEAGGRSRFQKIIVVDVPPPLQVARGVKRGMQAAEVRRRMAHQMDREDRLAAADYVIENSGSREDLQSATRRVYELLLDDLARMKRP